MACDCKINHVNYQKKKEEIKTVSYKKTVEIKKEEPKVVEKPKMETSKPKVFSRRKAKRGK